MEHGTIKFSIRWKGMVPKFVASHHVAFTSLTWRYKWPAVSWNGTVVQKLNWDQGKQRERGHGGKVRWASVTRLKLLKYFGQLQPNWTWWAACAFVCRCLFAPSSPCFLNFLSWPWSSLCVAIAFPSTKLPVMLASVSTASWPCSEGFLFIFL